MSKEFIEYMEEKIEQNNLQEGFDNTLLNLYKKGLIEVEMQDGEPLIKISEEGREAYLSEIALSFADIIEA